MKYPCLKQGIKPSERLLPWLGEIGKVQTSTKVATSWKLRFLDILPDLKKAVAALNSTDIPWIMLKGPVLAQKAYGSVFLRSFSDIDIYVKPQDFGKVLEVLISIGGHHRKGSEPELHEIAQFDSGLHIEVHRRLSREGWYDESLYSRMFENIFMVDVGDLHIPTAADELHAIYMALHAFNHSFLLENHWAVDLAMFIIVSNIDVSMLLETSRACGIHKIMYTSLALASEILDNFELSVKSPELSIALNIFLVRKIAGADATAQKYLSWTIRAVGAPNARATVSWMSVKMYRKLCQKCQFLNTLSFKN
ncbi:nucleotidyltransferase family protein [Myxococcota bacterium]|nr:nucleotidyltransferase family protein [Myxococcota bacterium]MBU1379804.1 nucleotidyltransferase family protein [Myxococcota bacterium]MBU1497126.1 nucleotidyltransferase family protein [Myxococcota bacterium]